jgi:hypothetical protein
MATNEASRSSKRLCKIFFSAALPLISILKTCFLKSPKVRNFDPIWGVIKLKSPKSCLFMTDLGDFNFKIHPVRSFWELTWRRTVQPKRGAKSPTRQ